jgi:hypothetical protein
MAKGKGRTYNFLMQRVLGLEGPNLKIVATVVWVLTTWLVLFSPHLSAQLKTLDEEPAKQVHWAMGAFFGTGWYRVDENRSVFVFRIPPRQTLGTASIDENGKRKLGVEIVYPISIGLHNLDQIPDFIDLENFGTVTFTPGVIVDIPVNPKWNLRPYAHIGYGVETTTSDSAWIYYGGIKSRYRLGDSSMNWALLNSLNYAGYKPEFKARGRYGSFMTGLEFSHRLGSLKMGDDQLRLNWHFTYNYLFDKLNFHVDEGHYESVQDQWEIGIALAKSSKKLKIWFLNFEHIGLSYRWSSNGNFKAISINLRSPFTE